MQHEITTPISLLDKHGHITEEGWARRPLWKYERKAIKSSGWRIKEWDYYAITSLKHKFAVTATVSDLGFGALFAIAFIDYSKQAAVQTDAMKFFTFGNIGLSPTSTEDNSVTWANKKLRIAFVKKGESRHLLFAAPHLELPDGRIGLDVNLTLTQPQEMESMNIATSWAENRKAFYLNEKVNCMPAQGTVRLGYDEIILTQDDAFGVLDWGRGRWTYSNRWYWGSASGAVDGAPFGFNIGYGFSDRTPASENLLYFCNTVHKLDEVTFHIPKDSYLEPWKFTSNDGRFEMDFQPAADRASCTNFLVIKSVQHQVFGYFSGTAILDDGTAITLSDFPGFAEDVYNRW